MNLSKDRKKAIKVVINLLTSCVTAFLLLVSTASFSEDIELYIGETIQQSKARPKVLIIFDNSGSMSQNTAEYKEGYVNDPDNPYDAVGSLNALSDKFIYFSKGGIDGASIPIVDTVASNSVKVRRFLDSINSCEEARTILETEGIYTGHIKEYTFSGQSGSWQDIPDNNGANINIIDCEADVLAFNPKNEGTTKAGDSLPEGYPVDGAGNKTTPEYYGATSNVSWSGPAVTLYTDNYLRWLQAPVEENPDDGGIPTVKKTRLEVAKESVTTIINTTPNVDFGLMVFNPNSRKNNETDNNLNGGRIVHGIQETTVDAKADLLGLIAGLNGDTWTPLCESLYEASQYFGGKSVDYGKEAGSSLPDRDTSTGVESSGVYQAPFSACSDKVYVVLITDGAPTYDMEAVDKVFDLSKTGTYTLTTADRFEVSDADALYYGQYSYLAALAGWMNTNDLNLSLDGKQIAEIHTIGFGEDAKNNAAPLLLKTAELGGGKYVYADDSSSLIKAFTNFLGNIEPSNNSLTSASVASNNFDRTETLDSVYYAMFQPDRGPRWQGNLKKYKVTDGVQKGANGVAAINQLTGHFSDEVQSYWSGSVDGDTVSEGGVAEMLRKKSGRVIYSDLGAANAMVALTYAEASASTAYPTQSDLATALDVANDQTAIKENLNWINGKDPDDEDDDGITDENRTDVFGDPLHSKPVIINYGNGKIYIVVGTNHGVLHMFEDNDTTNTVTETWAFMPKEFLPNINDLRSNFTSVDKVYGIDGLITAHIVDKNGDGIVDKNTDKVWLFFGYRRGGNSYYAMDVTDPADPSVMWTIEGGVTGSPFQELGQTWSQPKVTYSKLNLDGNTAKPVLIFGGGYDQAKDSHAIGGADSQGKAIFMVDAETGTLLWDLGPDGDTAFDGTDSIPSSIATLDSDGDGLTDRLYAGDTGGNVWRIDMPGSDKTKFSVFKLAEFGGVTTNAVDRRFFNEPSIVRAYITETIDSGKKDSEGKAIITQQDIPYDAVLLGSGDKSNPIGTNTDDVFFMIKDINIKTQQFTSDSIPAMPTSPIKIGNLADYTKNPFGATLTSQEKETLALAVSLKSGWFIELEQLGEKSTSSALVINNVVNFTTYTPPSLDVNSLTCDLPNGQGWLYAVDLSLGVAKYNWAAEDPNSTDDRKTFISEQFLGAPTLIVTKKTNPETNTEESDGNIIVGRKIIPVGFQLQTLRTYLYVTEN
jgi:type IV pilus assembly protein PilY1